jgi:type I restriction enzyme S subunit
MSDLPTGWAETTLSMVASITTGNTPSTKNPELYGGSVPFAKPGDLDTQAPITSTEQCLSEEGASQARLLRTGAVLVSCIGNLGKVGIAGTSLATNQQINSAEFYPFIVDDRYGYYVCKTLKPWMEREASATTIAILNKGRFSEAPFPLAPLPEQKRIADKLDSVLVRVDACRDRLDRLPALLKRFRQSILAAATSGRLTEDWRAKRFGISPIALDAKSPLVIFESDQEALITNWTWERLTSLAKLESGHTPRKSVPEYWENGTVPWISLQDIRAADGTEIFETKHKPTDLGIANSSARLLPKGTVCFCRDISFGYVTIMGREMSTTQHFANWICGEQLLPKYLMYSFMAARNHLAMSGQGTTVTTIYMPALKELRLATPPLNEQTEIVRRVEILFAFADRLEARLATARRQVSQLTPALLAKAFRGELVPQDPADEPATELLKRLAAQREAAPKAKRTRAKS